MDRSPNASEYGVPRLLATLRLGLRCGLVTGMAVGVLEGFSALGHVRATWGNIRRNANRRVQGW